MKKLILNLVLFLFIIQVGGNAQSITPYILNNGGGSATNMEWSMGEGVSISSFLSGGLALNTGVLQPMTNLVTGINEYGPAVFGNQISISPNPATNVFHFKARFNQVGTLSLQLIDSKSTLVYTQEAGTILSSYEKDVFIETFPAGVFYMRVYFKPNNGLAQTGIYKIVKL